MAAPPNPPGPPGGIPPAQPIPPAGAPVYGAPTQAYAPPPPPYGGHESRSAADQAAEFSRRHIRTPETKEFFKTSEFLVWLLTAVSVLIAGLTSDDYGAGTAWTLVTALSFAYIISRGIAKAGTRRGDPERFGGGH